MNFEDIAYLKCGSKRQQKAYLALVNNQIFLKLTPFDPIVVGTIPLNIDIESSDLDIICFFENEVDFTKAVIENFGNRRNFLIKPTMGHQSPSVVARFVVDDLEVEIFGQNVPTKQQLAYRHMVVEHDVLEKYGEPFRQQIIELKRKGNKTEPAFAAALGLAGDPYIELLKYEAK